MPFLVVRHKIADFGKWKPAFDSDADNRKEHGSQGGYILRNAEDTNEIVIILEWDSIKGMKEFVQSEKLKQAMQAGTVSDTPDVFILEEAERVTA